MTTTLYKNDIRKEFTDVYNLYYPLVFNTVYTKVSIKEDANDICQEIFLILLEKFESVEDAKRWLLGTMKNILYEYYRKRKKANIDIDIDSDFNDIAITFVNGMKETRILLEEAIDNIALSREESLILEYIAYYRRVKR